MKKLLLLAVMLMIAPNVHAADLRILAGASISTLLGELAPQFEKEIGRAHV